MEISKEKLNIAFKKGPEYKIFPATGAYGGPTPQGEILCNFYVEYRESPESITLEIDARGKTQEVERKHAPQNFVRELQVGILLRPDIARSIGNWLIQNSDKLYSPHDKLDS